MERFMSPTPGLKIEMGTFRSSFPHIVAVGADEMEMGKDDLRLIKY